MAVLENAPPTIHRGEDDLPFVDLGEGGLLQLLQVDLAQGIWVLPEANDEVTDVSFVIHGANLDLDAAGHVERVIDAAFILDFYRAMCADQHGLADPPVIVVEPASTRT